MAGWVIKRNDFPTIIDALPKGMDREVDDSANDLADSLKTSIWIDTGLLRRVTVNHEEGDFHSEISVGYYLGQGFYSGFQEFGTRHQAARPIVAPAAHTYEPIYMVNMERAIQKACDV